jgi:hypothetical protein
VRISDPDALAAYRSFEQDILAECDVRTYDDLLPLVHAVLQTYARALSESRNQPDLVAWATFVRSAAMLYVAFNRRRERRADPRLRRAATRLRQIVLENADLIDRTSRADAS